MAVDLWTSDSNCSLGISPRISFSHDLSHCDVIPVEQSVFRSTSSGNEFDFCTCYGYEQESSSADELFSGGKILPTEVKRKALPQPSPPPPPQGKPTPSDSHSDVAKTTSTTAGSDEKQTSNSKSFWRFKRSSSLNCAGSGYARSLCPLPLLLRSNSTGSSGASVKRSSQAHVKSYNNGGSVPSPLKPPSTNQKPPLKKNYHSNSSSSGGVRMNPALNVHSGNLFGLGSIFSGGKDRNRKKQSIC